MPKEEKKRPSVGVFIFTAVIFTVLIHYSIEFWLQPKGIEPPPKAPAAPKAAARPPRWPQRPPQQPPQPQPSAQAPPPPPHTDNPLPHQDVKHLSEGTYPEPKGSGKHDPFRDCRFDEAHQKTAKRYYISHPSSKIGLVLAANSGVAGGDLGKHFLLHDSVPGDILKKKMKTQEENVLQNWFHGSWILGRSANDTMNLIINKWGFDDPSQGEHETPIFMTKQGKNYNDAKKEDYEIFRDAWILPNQPLTVNKEDDKEKPFFVDLIFAAGPNANEENGKKWGSMKKTFIESVANAEDYAYFERMVIVAFESAMDIAIKNNVDILILPKISGGIYGGNPIIEGLQQIWDKDKRSLFRKGRRPMTHRDKIENKYPDIVKSLLEKPPHHHPINEDHYKRKYYFKRVCVY